MSEYVEFDVIGDIVPVESRSQCARIKKVRLSIQARFEIFHRENLWVYDALVSMAQAEKADGVDKMGIDLLWAGLRWNTRRASPSTTHSRAVFANEYRSRYSRLIMSQEPDLVDFFDTSELRSE
jgi:hypothetical protein